MKLPSRIETVLYTNQYSCGYLKDLGHLPLPVASLPIPNGGFTFESDVFDITNVDATRQLCIKRELIDNSLYFYGDDIAGDTLTASGDLLYSRQFKIAP